MDIVGRAVTSFQEFIEFVRGRNNKVQFHRTVNPQTNRVVANNWDDLTPIVAEQDYFEIRISNLFLKREREYWASYTPLLVGSLTFHHDGKADTMLPLVIDPVSLSSSQQQDGISLNNVFNLKAFGPYPYEGGDVSLALSMYAIKTDDHFQALFDITKNLLGHFQMDAFSSTLEAVPVLKNAIEAILDLKNSQSILEFYHSFQMVEGENRFSDQYLLDINASENDIDEQRLRVKDSRLHDKDGLGNLTRSEKWDYCLVRIIRHNGKEPMPFAHSQLPFHKDWKEMTRILQAEDVLLAEVYLKKLLGEISACASLTERDRVILQNTLLDDYAAEKEQVQQLKNRINAVVHGRHRGAVELRGANSQPEVGKELLKGWARSSTHRDVKEALVKLAECWSHVSATERDEYVENDENSDKIIAAKMEKIGEVLDANNLTLSSTDILDSFLNKG